MSQNNANSCQDCLQQTQKYQCNDVWWFHILWTQKYHFLQYSDPKIIGLTSPYVHVLIAPLGGPCYYFIDGHQILSLMFLSRIHCHLFLTPQCRMIFIEEVTVMNCTFSSFLQICVPQILNLCPCRCSQAESWTPNIGTDPLP